MDRKTDRQWCVRTEAIDYTKSTKMGVTVDQRHWVLCLGGGIVASEFQLGREPHN